MGRRQVRDNDGKLLAGTFLVGHERVHDAGLGGEIPGDVGKQRRQRAFAVHGFDENFKRIGEQRLLRARGDQFIGILCENREDFGAVHGRNVRAGAADGQLAFARGSTVAQIFEYFRAESFHRMPA